MYITVKRAAEKWGISDRRIRVLCAEGKIPGAYQEGRGWKIPADAKKPSDGRYKKAERLLPLIDEKKAKLDNARPLTQGELKRLNEDFAIEYTYNSNAIEGNTLTLRETDMVLRGLTIDKKPLKEHLEAIGHKEAFDYVSELVKENAELSESIIKQIHYLVLADKREDRGVFRRVLCSLILLSRSLTNCFKITPKAMSILLRSLHASILSLRAYIRLSTATAEQDA